jgi:2-C-methyl-D-erythritol 2,4-cyclodiphosphate synthase
MAADSPDKSRRHRVLVQGLTPARKSAAQDAGNSGAPSAAFLVGHGYDIHRLQSGGKLLLGGVIVSEVFSPIAHSDGDVVLHALVDAILGALGLGDIGELFPNSDLRWKDAPSRLFVEEVTRRMKQRNYSVSNLDVTILLERPKIGAHKSQIIASLRQLLGSGAGINVKAGTNEGCDAVGRGEAVAAHAVVLLASKS